MTNIGANGDGGAPEEEGEATIGKITGKWVRRRTPTTANHRDEEEGGEEISSSSRRTAL